MLTTVSTDVYNRQKTQAIEGDLLSKEITLSELTVNNPNEIEVSGRKMPITDEAFRKLIHRLKLPKSFANRFRKGFGDEALAQLVSMIKENRNLINDQTITLILNRKRGEITSILPAGYRSISAQGFFDTIERYINEFNLNVTHIGSNNGSIQVNAATSDSVMKLNGMPSEIFQTGVNFSNTHHGFAVKPFVTRLVCNNGMVMPQYESKFVLQNLSEPSLQSFNDFMRLNGERNFMPAGFDDAVLKAATTNASLAEVQYASTALLNAGTDVPYEYTQRYVPKERIATSYKAFGFDPEEMTSKQLQNANSGLSVWDLCNGMTNFASNSNLPIDDMGRSRVMVQAGSLLTKKQHDMSDLINVDPFSGGRMLTEAERKRMAGE